MELELNVNDYVRTKDKKGITYVRKVVKICTEYPDKAFSGIQVDIPIHNVNGVSIKNILKASYDITDLIEVGDYVDGHKVSKIIIDNDISNNDKLKFGDDDLTLTFKSNNDTYYVYVDDIQSIVTHEQFEMLSYKLGKED